MIKYIIDREAENVQMDYNAEDVLELAKEAAYLAHWIYNQLHDDGYKEDAEKFRAATVEILAEDSPMWQLEEEETEK